MYAGSRERSVNFTGPPPPTGAGGRSRSRRGGRRASRSSPTQAGRGTAGSRRGAGVGAGAGAGASSGMGASAAAAGGTRGGAVRDRGEGTFPPTVLGRLGATVVVSDGFEREVDAADDVGPGGDAWGRGGTGACAGGVCAVGSRADGCVRVQSAAAVTPGVAGTPASETGPVLPDRPRPITPLGAQTVRPVAPTTAFRRDRGARGPGAPGCGAVGRPEAGRGAVGCAGFGCAGFGCAGFGCGTFGRGVSSPERETARTMSVFHRSRARSSGSRARSWANSACGTATRRPPGSVIQTLPVPVSSAVTTYAGCSPCPAQGVASPPVRR
nr:hypothetical protein [Streptomyces sp. MH191]